MLTKSTDSFHWNIHVLLATATTAAVAANHTFYWNCYLPLVLFKLLQLLLLIQLMNIPELIIGNHSLNWTVNLQIFFYTFAVDLKLWDCQCSPYSWLHTLSYCSLIMVIFSSSLRVLYLNISHNKTEQNRMYFNKLVQGTSFEIQTIHI